MSGSAEPDRAFLAWGEGSNAAAILHVYAEKALGTPVRTDEGATPDGLDLTKLLFGLEELAEPGLAAHTETLREITHDRSRLAAWQRATQATDEGVRCHHNAPERALELYEDGRRRFEALGDRKGAGMCTGNIGLVHLERGDYSAAIELCSTALALHEAVRYARGQATHLLNLRRAFGALGRWDEALEVARRKAAILRWTAPTLGALWEADLGVCQLELGARSDARHSYERALAALPRGQLPFDVAALEDLSALASTFGDAGHVQALVGKTNAAIQHALESLDPRPQVGAGPILSRLQAAVASDDVTTLHRAVTLSLPWSLMAIESLNAQAVYFLLRGDRTSADACEAHLTALAYGIFRSFGLRWPLDEAMLIHGWDEQKRIAKARAYGLKAQALAQSWSGEDGDLRSLLAEAKELHDLIGDRDAVGPWFPEAERAIEMDRVEMHTLVQMAESKTSLGYAREARNNLESALAIAEKDGDRLSVADKYVRLAILAQGERDMETASSWFQRAQDAFDEVEEIGVSAHDDPGRALNRIKLATHFGEFLNHARRPDEAWILLGRALPTFEWFLEAYEGSGALSDRVARARDYKGRALYARAIAAERLGLFEQGLEVAREAAAWFKSIGDRPGQAAAHHAMTLVLRELGRYPEALAAAERDVALQRELGSDREIAVALTAEATIAEATGDLKHAQALSDEAAGLTDDPGPQSDAVFLLGQVASGQGEWAEAERHYQRALDLDRGRGDKAAVLADLAALAWNQLRSGSAADAIAPAREAWQGASTLPSMPDRISAGTALAAALLAEGGQSAWSEAVQVLYEVCRLTEQLRGALREEGHRIAQTGKGLVAHDLLVRALAAPIGPDAPAGLGAAAFDAVERAKSRALVEAIASGAAAEAEAGGIRLFRGIVEYVRDPREELTKTGFADILRLLQEECEAR